MTKATTCLWIIITLLSEELEERKTLACWYGLSLPKDICDAKSNQVKILKRGESLYRQKDTLTCMTCCERRSVSFLGTGPTREDDSGAVERSVKVIGLCTMLTWVMLMSSIRESTCMQDY